MLIFYQNTNGICTKLGHLGKNLRRTDYDVVLLSETKLNENYGSLQSSRSRYHIYRRDRDERSGGGVMIAVGKDRNFQKRKWDSKFVEDIWMSMNYRNYTVHICCVYIVPQCHLNRFAMFINNVAKRMKDNPGDYFLIVGDFNMPKFTLNKAGKNGGKLKILQDFCEEFELKQFNRGKNQNDVTLDLVLCNKKISCRKTRGLVKEDDHHPAFEIEL